MFKDKRIPYAGAAAVFLAAASVAMLLLACRAESPAEGLGGGWEDARQACDTMAESDYDVVKVLTFEAVGDPKDGDFLESVETYAFSGADFHMVGESYIGDRETLAGKGKSVFKDGVLYFRETSSPDEPDTWTEWEAEVWADMSGGPTELPYPAMPCFGAEEAGGATENSAERYFFWRTTTGLRNETSEETHEFWVDPTGRPVRSLSTTIVSSELIDSMRIVRIEATYSGFGGANTITAPVETS